MKPRPRNRFPHTGNSTRLFCRSLLLTSLLLLAWAGASAAAEPARPNILLVLSDDHSVPHRDAG